MSFRCDIPCIVCAPSIGGGVGPVDPANPFVNLSSEAPDHDDFIGRRYSIGYPPLGSTWYAVGCIGWCLSSVSQEDADLCAAQQAVLCQSTNWPLVEPNPQGPPPFLPRNRPVFYNNAQVCPFVCPDGSVYNFVVAAGIFASVFNQETADLMAYSYACNKAVANHMCLSALTPVRTCSSALYNGTIIASTSNTPVSFEVVGSLPDGLLLVQNETTAFIQGTPTTPGDYSFTIRATDSIHQSVDKVVDFSVFGVATITPMPDGAVGQAYSETLQYGGTPRGTVVWAITNGELPDGLTLNTSTGEISGSPTTDETQSFTVSVTDGILTCFKQLAIEVLSLDCPNWSLLFWNTANKLENGGTATFIPQLASSDTASVTLVINSTLGSNVSADDTATILYNGPGCNCNLRFNIVYIPAPEFPDTVQYAIISSLYGVIVTAGLGNVSGVVDVPFSLQDTLGADDTITVLIVGNIANNFGGEAARTQIFTAALSNV